MSSVFYSLCLVLFFSSLTFAKKTIAINPKTETKAAVNTLISLKPEALGAKAFLEDILARRYAQELSSIIKKEDFNLGVKLDLAEVPPVNSDNEPAEEPLTDLALGKLDPESLFKKYSTSSEEHSQAVEAFLKNYRIQTVFMNVGLNEDLGTTTQADVEKWMTARISEEFGTAGKSQVVFTKNIIEKTPDTFLKSVLHFAEKFQSLAAQLVLIFGIFIGIILWKMLSKPFTLNANGDLSTNSNLNSTKEASSDKLNSNKDQTAVSVSEERQTAALNQDFLNLKAQLLQVMPKIKNDLESIVRSWCQMGEEGLLRLACFAETVGQEHGRLPIPVDSMASVSKVFIKMIDLNLIEKKSHLQKAYWDLLSVLNLGAEALEKPFGYISQTNFHMMKEVLMNQNVKMQTLVSLYMSVDQRKDYLKSMSDDAKIELLKSAAGLSQVETSEFKAMDKNLKNQLKPKSSNDSVPLEMTLNKLVESMTITDQIKILPALDSQELLGFKQKFSTLAFIHEWPVTQLQTLLSKTMGDEIVAYLTLKPESKDLFLSNCPPFTAELVKDELDQNKNLSPDELEAKLILFSKRLEQMTQSRDIKLEEIFSENSATNNATGDQLNNAKTLKNISQVA